MQNDFMSLYGNSKTEVDGLWYEPGGPTGPAFLLRRAGGINHEFKQHINKAVEALLKEHKKVKPTTQEIDDCERVAFGRFVLIGWKNVSIDGKVLEYSADQSVALLEKYPDLYNDLRKKAQDEDWFRLQLIEEISGNSPAS